MLKSQDVLVALKLAAHRDGQWRYEELSEELGLSYGVTFDAVKRGSACGLIDQRNQRAIVPALLELLVHGLRYVFPPVRGPLRRGIPTGPSASPLLERLATSEPMPIVWPHPKGAVRGESLAPLHEAAPEAARRDPELYALLAVVDGIRLGGARVRAVATEVLEELLSP